MNLAKLNVQELTQDELKNTEGGLFGLGLLLGALIGWVVGLVILSDGKCPE